MAQPKEGFELKVTVSQREYIGAVYDAQAGIAARAIRTALLSRKKIDGTFSDVSEVINQVASKTTDQLLSSNIPQRLQNVEQGGEVMEISHWSEEQVSAEQVLTKLVVNAARMSLIAATMHAGMEEVRA